MELQRGDFILSTDPARLDLDLVHGYLATGSYWARGIARERVERAIRNSLCFGVYDGPAQVGFARVVTDRATFAWLCDVFVMESHRGRGLGAWLAATVTTHPELAGLRRWFLATQDAHQLYERHGWKPLSDPTIFLEIMRPYGPTG